MIAVACSINHAQEIRSLYQERAFTADVIHSKQSHDERAAILKALRNGTLDCIVQVQILGEGFDHPKLSVAAIFRPFRTLAPYVQFVGRIMRVIVQNDTTHPDNVGHIVTHLGMNLDERLKEFKQFENDDQAFWDKVIGGDEPEISRSVLDGSQRRTAAERLIVHEEIVESLWEEDFITVEDQYIVDELRDRFKSLGLDSDRVEEFVRQARGAPMRKHAPSEPFLVQPQREWREARKRLDEQAKRLAKLLLNNVGLSTEGTELADKYRSLGISGRNNFVSALIMVNREINKRLGKERVQASAKEFKQVLDNLDDLLQKLVRRVHKAKAEYDQKKEEN